jgi:hypothetical protein
MGVEDLNYQKYLKYKNKYLNLQSQIGGGSRPFSLSSLIPRRPAQRQAEQAAEEAKQAAEEAKRQEEISKEINDLNNLRNEELDDIQKLDPDYQLEYIVEPMYRLIKIGVKKLFNEKKRTHPEIILKGSNDSSILAFDESEINTYLPQGTTMDLNKKNELENEIKTLKPNAIVKGVYNTDVVAKIHKLQSKLYDIYKAILDVLDLEEAIEKLANKFKKNAIHITDRKNKPTQVKGEPIVLWSTDEDIVTKWNDAYNKINSGKLIYNKIHIKLDNSNIAQILIPDGQLVYNKIPYSINLQDGEIQQDFGA